MFRAAPRLIARSALPRSIAPARRYLSTAPPTQKSRSWKSLAARFGIAGTLIYYYNTVDVFAEEPNHPAHLIPETDTENEHLPTIESLSEERQKRKAVQAQLDAQVQAQQDAQSAQQDAPTASGNEGGIEGLEAEAGQQGAFNPETGEINWDCPCLGGMATGPCGEQFKAAFSCFVYSEEEPKGMDCIDKFKGMQDCFREHPDVYGSELEGAEDEDEGAELAGAEETNASRTLEASSRPASDKGDSLAHKAKSNAEPSSTPHSTDGRPPLDLVPDNYKPDTKTEEPVSESEELVPRAAHGDGVKAQGRK